MNMLNMKHIIIAALAAASLAACGGGGNSAPATAPSTLPQEPGAPTFLGDTAIDGLNWINYRRGQAGMPVLLHNTLIDKAAQGHSAYQKTNNTVTHVQVAGKPGFTGVGLLDRLTAAGYVFGNSAYAYGEVISATASTSGFVMAEDLITAIYHRFVIFEPKFKEIGTGSAVTSAGYTYFTSNFTANNGYGPGLGAGNLVTWPFQGQTKVLTNFFSDDEAPDPVPNVNEVGYPISVHADINALLRVATFSVRERGAANVLAVRLLSGLSDPDAPQSAAAIIPLSVLKGATTYDVSFSGTVDGAAVSRDWSFTTK